MTNIGRHGRWNFSWNSRSQPLTSAMQRSVMTRSGSCSCRYSSASSPFFAAATCHPSVASTRRRPSRTAESSSTRRMDPRVRSETSGVGGAAATASLGGAGAWEAQGGLAVRGCTERKEAKRPIGWIAVAVEFSIWRFPGNRNRWVKFLPVSNVRNHASDSGSKAGCTAWFARKTAGPSFNLGPPAKRGSAHNQHGNMRLEHIKERQQVQAIGKGCRHIANHQHRVLAKKSDRTTE